MNLYTLPGKAMRSSFGYLNEIIPKTPTFGCLASPCKYTSPSPRKMSHLPDLILRIVTWDTKDKFQYLAHGG